MILDFSLVFLLLISDRRNLHCDSRRDTEQNVPWEGAAHLVTRLADDWFGEGLDVVCLRSDRDEAVAA